MASCSCIFSTLALIFISITMFLHPSSAIQQKTDKLYIVHVTLPKEQTSIDDLESFYKSFLPESSRMLHMYRHVLTGFAAKLSPEELHEMEKKDGFLYARPQRRHTLHTTHTPNFLGLYESIGVWPTIANYGKGVVIGVLDSGVARDHPSFLPGVNYPPPPSKWKGKCDFNGKKTCNNKLIGARNLLDAEPPTDDSGHGTHTASTAAGSFVPGANVFGQANGTASGMAPLAHVAVYKVCYETLCDEGAVLSAIDAAIEDGVDVLSISLGGGEGIPFYESSTAIGSFAAARKGIFVSCSGGNIGPLRSTVDNAAPWILTVGASTVDRKIVATARLGNGEEFDGESSYQPKDFPPTLLPLIDGSNGSESCLPGSLDNMDVRGKVVFCVGINQAVQKSNVVKAAHGAAMILANEEVYGNTTLAYPYALPATYVSYASGRRIKAYINSSSSPTATILFKGTIIGDKRAPVVASFSARGPNYASPGILKPDIIGPGVNILGAWNQSLGDNSTAAFYIDSGTSMSCPHLSGIAALIKSAHPSWSPAMIKSAIMTTATQTNLNHSPILDDAYIPAADVFAVGAGHVNPTKALNPGLVYDLTIQDYIPYLCFLYNGKQVSTIVKQNIDCNEAEYKGIPEAQLNYPSFAVTLGRTSLTYTRTVTNVGEPGETVYSALIEGLPGVNLVVEPNVLVFTKLNEKKTYKVRFTRQEALIPKNDSNYVEGSISWVCVKHNVRIPISVKMA